MITHRSKGFVYPDYVSPLPADEFLKGVQYKQKMFDEGVALVNSQLDTYRDVRNSLLKDQDKKYFDQEATKLVNALNKTAGLDFSIKGNVTAALNTGKQLVNDQYIKSAAESSATYKKMLEEYGKLDASKKSNVNDFFFFNEIKNWQNDGKVGSKLNYNPYTVYTDEHVKLWNELSKTLKPEEVEYPEMTPGGDWIMKKSFSGVSAERFRKAYMTGLSAQGKNQLDMEARYRVMNSDKDGLVKSYYQNHETILTDINNKMAKNEADKNELIKKYGPKSPEVMRINQANNDLNLSRQYYNEQMSKPYDQISDNDLVGFIKDNMINDASGAFAYQNKKEELQQNPYAVDRAQMMNNIAEAQAKARIDIAKEMELDRLGLSARKAAKAGAEETLPPGTYVPDASYEKQPGIQSFIDWYGQSSTLAEGEQNSLAIQRFAGDKTIQQTLDRADDENNWPNPVDRRTINETFTSPEMAEQFFWKLKGIVKVIKGKTILKDSSGNDIVVGDSTIVSIRDQNGNVQDMPMKAFLSKPGKALAGMLDIKIKTN
jgi:hypothetical protein